jgi:hypothetical protein
MEDSALSSVIARECGESSTPGFSISLKFRDYWIIRGAAWYGNLAYAGMSGDVCTAAGLRADFAACVT